MRSEEPQTREPPRALSPPLTYIPERGRAFSERERSVAERRGITLPAPAVADPQAQARRALELLQHNNARELIGMFRGMQKAEQQAIVAAFEAMPNIRRMPFLGERRTFETIARRRLSVADGVFLSAILRNPSSVPTNADRAEAALRQQSSQQLLALYRELSPADIAEMERDYPSRYGGDLHERVAGAEVEGRRRGGALSGDELAAYTRLRTGQSEPAAAAVPPEQLRRQRVETLTRLLGPQALLDMPAIEATMREIPAAERPAIAEDFRAANGGRTVEASLEALMQRSAVRFGAPLPNGALPGWMQTRFEHLRDSWQGTRAPEAVMLDAASGRLPDAMAADAIRRMTPAELADLRPRFERAYRERFPAADASGVFERTLERFSASSRREIELHAAIGDVYRTRDFAAAEARVRGIWDAERSVTQGGWQEFRNRFMSSVGVTGPELDETARRFFDGAHDLRRRVEGGHTPNADDVAGMMRNYRAFGQRLEAYYVERGETAQSAAAMAALVGGLGFGAVLGGASLTTRGIIASSLVGATAQTAVTRALDPEVTTQQLALSFALGASLETAGGMAIRGGIRAWQARRGAPGAAEPGPHAAADGRFNDAPVTHASFLPAREVPNPRPRYLGRATVDGKEVEVRAFDSGRIELGDRVFEGRLNRDHQALYFRGPDGQQWSAQLTGMNNEFGVGPVVRSRYSAVIDNELVQLRGSTVTGQDGRVIGFASSLEDGRIATRIDPSDPFAAEIGRIMSVRGRALRPMTAGDTNSVITPDVGGPRYVIDANGRASRADMIGNRLVLTRHDGQTRVVVTGPSGARVEPLRPGIHVLSDDAILADGRLQWLTPTETPGMVIGRGLDDSTLAVYRRAADGSLSSVSPAGASRLLSAADGQSQFIVAPGPNGRAVVHLAYHAERDGSFRVRAADGTVRYARRLRPNEFAIEDNARFIDGSFIMGGGYYRREVQGVLDDGTKVWAARRNEGSGPGWRLMNASVDGRLTPLTPRGDAPMILRHAGTREPTAIIDRGIIFGAELAPDAPDVLTRRVLGFIGAGRQNFPADQRPLLEALQRVFGNDEAAMRAALDGRDRAALRRLDEAVGPGGRERLWRAFGLVSEQRDPLIYATRLGALNDPNPSALRLPTGPRVSIVDHPDDIGVYRMADGRLRRATDDEIRAQFDAMVPQLTRPVRNSEWEAMARPTRVTLEGQPGAPERFIIIERPGVPPQRVRVTVPASLQRHVPTPEQLVDYLGTMPNIALRNLDTIDYASRARASYSHGSRTLHIGNNALWNPFEVDTIRTLAHELLGHGLEMNDPLVHRALLLARRLDGIGTTRPYGAINRHESFAVGIEDTIANAEDAVRRTPHASRVFWHLLRDQTPTTSPEARRALMGGMSLALLFGIFPRPPRAEPGD